MVAATSTIVGRFMRSTQDIFCSKLSISPDISASKTHLPLYFKDKTVLPFLAWNHKGFIQNKGVLSIVIFVDTQMILAGTFLIQKYLLRPSVFANIV